MDSMNQIQILDKAVYVSLYTNALSKDMNLSRLTTTMDNPNLGKTTSQEEGTKFEFKI